MSVSVRVYVGVCESVGCMRECECVSVRVCMCEKECECVHV